jgi:hypothetical protein
MRRLTFRDAIATVVLAAVAIPYIGYVVWGEVPLVQDPRGMAAVGILGLILSFLAWGIGLHSTFGKVMLLVGLAAIGIGLAAAFIGSEGSELLLVFFMAVLAIVYVAEIAYHATVGRPAHHST